MSETQLERALAGSAAGHNATALDAFRAARQKFLRGERVDMQVLASELGVGRATLYRWVGSRELLLGEVLWSFTEATLDRLRAEATKRHPGDGIAWFMYIYEQYGIDIVGFTPLRAWIDSEPELAMRVMTSKHAQQQRRVIAAYEDILREAIDDHGLQIRLEVHTLAYVLVRLGESYLWTDLITGEEPDLHQAHEVARVLIT
jgi:AcrR family transcriptional regulator